MKTLKRSLLIIALAFTAKTIAACCGCDESITYRYKIQQLTTSNLDNSGATPIITSNSSIAKFAYGIRVSTEGALASLENNSFSFFATANAMSCDCPPPWEYIPADSVESVQIISINDFDDTHTAGTDVSFAFKIYLHSQYIPIEQYISDYHNRAVYNESEIDTNMDLLMMTLPTAGIDHQFKVILTLKDGTALESTLSPVTLVDE